MRRFVIGNFPGLVEEVENNYFKFRSWDEFDEAREQGRVCIYSIGDMCNDEGEPLPRGKLESIEGELQGRAAQMHPELATDYLPYRRKSFRGNGSTQTQHLKRGVHSELAR